jgi:hypothetical protein
MLSNPKAKFRRGENINMNRLLIAMALLLVCTSANAEEFKAARLLDAEAYTEHQTTGAVIKGNGGIYSIKHDMNRIAVALDGMKVTAVFEAHWSWSPKASNLVIGTAVQAKLDKENLVVKTSDGKTIKAHIVRREDLVSAGSDTFASHKVEEAAGNGK